MDIIFLILMGIRKISGAWIIPTCIIIYAVDILIFWCSLFKLFIERRNCKNRFMYATCFGSANAFDSGAQWSLNMLANKLLTRHNVNVNNKNWDVSCSCLAFYGLAFLVYVYEVLICKSTHAIIRSSFDFTLFLYLFCVLLVFQCNGCASEIQPH